jgi:NAD(P)-dependent dehydrogenase (short-subunit alcohol dehydrogenase family)
MNLDLWRREFSNKRIMLTGGSGQIGSVIAGAYRQAGAIVVNLDRVPPDIQTASPAASPPKPSAGVYFLEADITRPVDVARAVETTVSVVGRIDILINCAGIGVFTPLENRTEDEFDSVIDVNLKGTFLVTQAVSRGMVEQGAGVILNIGSIYGVSAADQRMYGKSGRNSSEVYAMAKAGVIHFTRYMARYLAPHNIRVNCVSPGGVFADQDAEFVKNYVDKTPLGRMGAPEDLVGGVFYLTSSLSLYVTGQNLVIDGGFTIGD